ncbi:MAG: hypothetical protein WC312_04325 [Candidatus Omnitrophota bacterium]
MKETSLPNVSYIVGGRCFYERSTVLGVFGAHVIRINELLTQEAICDTFVYTDRKDMKHFKWSLLKNERLKKVRGASFDDIVNARFVGVKKHPKNENQNILLFEYKNYIWLVPYVEDESYIFLKTIYPSRKFTKIYREGGLK